MPASGLTCEVKTAEMVCMRNLSTRAATPQKIPTKNASMSTKLRSLICRSRHVTKLRNISCRWRKGVIFSTIILLLVVAASEAFAGYNCADSVK